jgi:hypothetical protein
MYNLDYYNKLILNKTNPYKSIEQYKTYFKTKFLGVNYISENVYDSDNEEIFRNNCSIIEDDSKFEFNFILDDLFTWENPVTDSIEINKLVFLDNNIETCILSFFEKFENQEEIFNNTFFDFKSLYAHSNCLFFSTLNNYYFMFLFNQILKKKNKFYLKNLNSTIFYYNNKLKSFVIYITKLNSFYLISVFIFCNLWYNYLSLKKKVLKNYKKELIISKILIKKNRKDLIVSKKLIKNNIKDNIKNLIKILPSFKIQLVYWLYDFSKMYNLYLKTKKLSYSLLEIKILKWKFQINKKKSIKNLNKRIKKYKKKLYSRDLNHYTKRYKSYTFFKNKYKLQNNILKNDFEINDFEIFSNLYNSLDQFYLKSKFALLNLKKFKIYNFSKNKELFLGYLSKSILKHKKLKCLTSFLDNYPPFIMFLINSNLIEEFDEVFDITLEDDVKKTG